VVVATNSYSTTSPGIIRSTSRGRISNALSPADPRTLKLIKPIDYRPPAQVYFDNKINSHTADINRTRYHIVLTDGTFEWTSVLAFFVKSSARNHNRSGDFLRCVPGGFAKSPKSDRNEIARGVREIIAGHPLAGSRQKKGVSFRAVVNLKLFTTVVPT
jgi:hypothetical protein